MKLPWLSVKTPEFKEVVKASLERGQNTERFNEYATAFLELGSVPAVARRLGVTPQAARGILIAGILRDPRRPK